MPAVMMTKVMPMAMMPVSDTARTMLAMLSGSRNRISSVTARREDDTADRHDHQADQALEAHDQRQRIAMHRCGGHRADCLRDLLFRHQAFLPFAAVKHRVLVDAADEFRNIAPLAQHHDPVAQADQLRHLARGDQYAEPLRGQLPQPGVDLALGADIDAAGRLVEQQQPGIAEDLLGQHDLLLVAARQGADRDVWIPRPDVELAEGLLDRFRLGGAATSSRPARCGASPT